MRISATGYVLLDWGLLSPWLGDGYPLCGVYPQTATLYESGIVQTPQGLIYDPPFSEQVFFDWEQTTINVGERHWVVVPSCDQGTTAFVVRNPVDNSLANPFVFGPPIPDAMKQAICNQFANDFLRDPRQNVHGQYIENVGDRAFLYTPVPDSDGDGVPDTADQCPGSATIATVVLGSCDSGVANFVATNGCTVIDNINSCKQGAQNAGSMTSCVAHYLNSLVPTHLSGQEKGRIQGCLRGIR